jgi:hypothetical protein
LVVAFNSEIGYNQGMNKITIERAYGMDKRGNDILVGFDIMVNGEWGNRFRTLRECREALLLDGIQYTPQMRKTLPAVGDLL